MKFKKLISLLLVIMMMAVLVPAAAVLAEEEQVITDKVETAKKEALAISGGAAVNVKYDGKSHTIATPKVNNSKYTIKYSTDGGAKWTTKKPTFKDIGLHKIVIGAFKSGKSTPSKTKSTYVNIFPKAAKVSFIGSGKTYTQSLGADFTMVYKAGGYELSGDFTGTEEYRPWFKVKYNNNSWQAGKPNVTIEKCGDYIIKVYAKIGTVSNQYVGTIKVSILPTITVEIDAKKKESASFTADGTSHKVTATLNDGGAGYKLQYYYNGKWRTAPLETAEMGSYTVKFRALNSSNEVVRNMPTVATMTIGPKLTVNNVSVVYDGEPHMLDVEVSGGLEYSLTYSADGGKTWTKQCPTLTDPGKMTVKVKLTASNGTSTTKTGTVEVKPGIITEGTVVPTSANLYAEGKADAKVLGKALKDEVCEVLAVQGDWTKVRLNGTVGYIETEKLAQHTRPFDPAEDPLNSGSANSMVLHVKSGTPQAWEGPKDDGTYDKVQLLAADGKYTVLSKYKVGTDTWYRIQVTSTKEGFVKYDSTKMELLTGAVTQYGTITNCTTSVVVRKGAGTDYAKLGTAKKGAVFGILARAKDSKGVYWYKIQYNAATEGWVSSEYVSLGIVNPSGGDTVTTGTYCTIANINEWCNVREKATTSSALLGQALLGAKYKVLGTTTDWVKIQYGEKEAWVYRKYTSLYTETEGDITVPTEVKKQGFGFAIAVTDATVYDSIYFDHKAVGAVADHVVCKVLAKDGNYFKIEFGDGTGYVHKSQFNYIYTKDYNPGTKKTAKDLTYYSQASDAPGSEMPGTIAKDTTLTVLGTDGTFTVVQYAKRAYYVKTADLP